jgi:hypothetical protein
MHCLIVKRGDPGRYDLLYKTFSQQIPVVWEGRRRDRRHAAGAIGEERRHHDRRGPAPLTWTTLGFAVGNREG